MLLIDLIIINSVIFYVSDKEYLQRSFLIYINFFWLASAFIGGFYKVFRHTKYFHLFRLLFVQFVIFFLGFFAYFSLFREGDVVNNQTVILTTIFLTIALLKWIFLFALRKYRSSGMNYRKVIVLGSDDTAKKLISLLNKKRELGYVFTAFFSDKTSKDKFYKGSISDSFKYVLDNNIDEIYCSLTQFKKEEIKKLKTFTSENDITLKLIPNANEILSKNYTAEYYDESLLILNVNRLPFEYRENRLLKRIFDILFSSFVIIFIMSWLTPIIWLIIKLESNGPAFFKQKREGLKGQLFVCYKFRSMRVNVQSQNTHTTKNDVRVTKVGSFLRKTSLDELPQFFNVLKGDMSVVGPRPHLKSLSIEYQKNVNNYLDRHAVKPGITGLAQVSGYRGEIKKKSDIKNRIRFDIFYIENWSIFLDIKIIFKTIFNVFKGEEKAY